MNVKTELLLDMARNLQGCERCTLCEHRSRVVFGSGNPNASVMFLGEAPGKDEDESGLPFVGRAGKLLTKMIESIGLIRDEVYIANVVKCRPENNRNPTIAEVAKCTVYLDQQIEIIQPKVIVVLGKVAASTLTFSDMKMAEYRNMNPRKVGTLTYIYTYHPAYLLRSPGMKAEAWKDLQLARKLL